MHTRSQSSQREPPTARASSALTFYLNAMAVTEIILTGGDRITVNAAAQVVEAAILAAARGSIMELAWMTDAQTGQRVGVNPDHVLMLRELETGAGPA